MVRSQLQVAVKVKYAAWNVEAWLASSRAGRSHAIGRTPDRVCLNDVVMGAARIMDAMGREETTGVTLMLIGLQREHYYYYYHGRWRNG